MERERLIERCDARGVNTLTLNRPERHNAFDGLLVAELTAALQHAAARSGTRALVLESTGASFSAGADIAWMRARAHATADQNADDAATVLRMLRTLDDLPLPTLAVVQGDAFGGAVGLIACCDIVLAAETANFAISEVRLGLSPTAIGPYVGRAIGTRQARRYFVSGEPITARRALEIGLVHETAPPDRLATTRDRIIAALLRGAPEAQRDAKSVAIASGSYPGALVPDEEAARRVAARRARPEAREGMAAFLERRRPAWVIA